MEASNRTCIRALIKKRGFPNDPDVLMSILVHPGVVMLGQTADCTAHCPCDYGREW